MSNPSPDDPGRGLFALFDWLTSRMPWRLNARPFPVIVLDAEAGAGPAVPEAFVEELKHAAAEMALPVVSPVLTDSEGDGDAAELTAAIALIDRLSQPLTWSNTRSQFGRFRFPRADLVQSFQAAARQDGENDPPYRRSPVSAVAVWNERAGLFRWPGDTLRAPAWWSTVGGSLLAVVAVLAGGIADQTNRKPLITAAALVIALLLLLVGLTTRRLWLPVLSRLGWGSRYRWFASTSFFAVLGDGDEDGDDLGFEGRMHRVFDRLTKPDAARFLLQMKTFALLEDMRHNHRRFAPSLRGFKRPAPPVVFLSGVGSRNGGVHVLSSMSDIRARRSEFPPLVVIATMAPGHGGALGGPAGAGDPPKDRYEQWRSSLGTAQSPSEAVPLPWLLRIPVGGDPRAERSGDDAPAFLVRRRPRWTWLWSWRSLVTAAALGAVAATYAQVHLRSTYCHVDLAFNRNTDTRLRGTGTDRECIGVSTDGTRFERTHDSVTLAGERRLPNPNNKGAGLTLADLQRKIHEENERILKRPDPYVTLIYAGVLAAPEGQDDRTVSSIEELAGAYLSQMRNNDQGANKIDNPLKVRLLPANTGQDMKYAVPMADLILRLARNDPTVVGVVGIGRNTRNSETAINDLVGKGLPVVNTVNSSDALPRQGLPFYGLAATNQDEAAATTRVPKGDRAGRALIVRRKPGPSGDLYSKQIADDAIEALKLDPQRDDDVVDYTDDSDIGNIVQGKCTGARTAPYGLVYFAGRAEDLPGLMNGLVLGECAGGKKKLSILAGDDVTKIRFGNSTDDNQVELPPNVTVYHTAFVYLPTLLTAKTSRVNAFFKLTDSLLGIGGSKVREDEPLLADGQMALGYDAVVALSQAAQNAFSALRPGKGGGDPIPGSSRVTSGSVLLELRRLRVPLAATGDIDFNGYPDPGHQGLTLLKVAPDKKGTPERTLVCGKINGDRRIPGLKPCPTWAEVMK
ncbi:hypothetical protein [Actinomadura xylanilytica]|uniref:hypothetical protein n=1 Tax=Actinomadura xylanilytica TaxID=887459 RepID=UPI00255ACB39|nr:hypothetical protein [Actinomadura xylanilytica]MDL4770906.1 hypothetical protein [Actinomadura xylanilytica]